MASLTQNKFKEFENKPFVVVDFLDIDPECIRFQEPKTMSNGNKVVPLRYNVNGADKTLHVKYTQRTCPFGLSTNTEKKDEYRGKYENGEKITGYSTSISFLKDEDPYLAKAEELDQFFIDKCVANSVSWGLGGSKSRPIERSVIEGYDDKGWNGKWKRLVKYAYKVDKNTKDRIYQDYPPRMEFGVQTESMTESLGDNGLMKQRAVFKPTFFNANRDKVFSTGFNAANPKVSSDDISEILPKWSRVSLAATWGNLSLGTYGASIKPKILQVQVFPNERLDNDTCLLDDGADADGEPSADLSDMLASSTIAEAAATVPAVKVKPQTAKKPVAPPPALEESEEPEEEAEPPVKSRPAVNLEDEEEQEVEEAEPEPPKPVVRTTRVIAPKKK
jgi:hypothetical protein